MDSNITSLLDGNSTTDSSALSSSILPAGFTGLFTAFMVITLILSIVLTVLYILNMVTTYRAHKASIETRDILREMNERDKARSSHNHQAEPYASTAGASSTEATSSSSSAAS